MNSPPALPPVGSKPSQSTFRQILDYCRSLRPINSPTVRHRWTPNGVSSTVRPWRGGASALTFDFCCTIAGEKVTVAPGHRRLLASSDSSRQPVDGLTDADYIEGGIVWMAVETGLNPVWTALQYTAAASVPAVLPSRQVFVLAETIDHEPVYGDMGTVTAINFKTCVVT